ncbi:hypothetical protein GALMADRAFT_160433 [Galerina marginata CBS 339.88]|uniref:F-box domain-containing protein n=1 Tax=Galerina marginata (strain CBS 339.88) TaxID=685588 RepID=A0A067SRI7_GALM3|nr:hypothetical protein GALMADRAFT_160433 [Galerina marginata CBS 339.88]
MNDRPNSGSRGTSPPPIFSLHKDILWRIFTLNTIADVDFTSETETFKSVAPHEFSLITARHTSQVCASWRVLMLASSSLWANALNLKHLNQTNDHWRAEILKRTRNSVLSVMGVLYEGRPATPFFLSLLGDEWTRLRRVFISVADDNVADDGRWPTMGRPAPNLEIFRLEFCASPAFSTADDILFSNTAPRIHTLSTWNLNFKVSGPWLSHLRILELRGYISDYRILFALAEMSSLETLVMSDGKIINADADDHQSPSIILPNLKLLTLSAEPATLIVLLGHITPTSGCSSELESINSVYPSLSAAQVSLFQRNFASHFQFFSDFRRNEEIKQPDQPHFEFHVEVDTPWHDLSETLLNCLYSCAGALNSVKILELDTGRAFDDDDFDPSGTHVIRLFKSLVGGYDAYRFADCRSASYNPRVFGGFVPESSKDCV